jgi:hypothetical protein
MMSEEKEKEKLRDARRAGKRCGDGMGWLALHVGGRGAAGIGGILGSVGCLVEFKGDLDAREKETEKEQADWVDGCSYETRPGVSWGDRPCHERTCSAPLQTLHLTSPCNEFIFYFSNSHGSNHWNDEATYG